MSSKLDIESLPVTEENIPRRRLVQERGELAFIEDGGDFGHLTFFTIKAGKGLYRGRHVHERKVEHFYLARGEALLEWADLDTGATGRVRLGTGDIATVRPRLAHRLSCPHGECFVVEYFKGRHEAGDDIPFDAFPGSPAPFRRRARGRAPARRNPLKSKAQYSVLTFDPVRSIAASAEQRSAFPVEIHLQRRAADGWPPEGHRPGG